jgi:adenosine deaminase
LGNPQGYPLLRYLQTGVPVTINTDNIGISAASLTDNFLLLPRLCPGITRLQILQLLRNSVDQAFLASSAKSLLLSKITINH